MSDVALFFSRATAEREGKRLLDSMHMGMDSFKVFPYVVRSEVKGWHIRAHAKSVTFTVRESDLEPAA